MDFHPDISSGPVDNLIYNLRMVAEVCEACPVRLQCLQWAESNRETEGVWGGVLFHGSDRLPLKFHHTGRWWRFYTSSRLARRLENTQVRSRRRSA